MSNKSNGVLGNSIDIKINPCDEIVEIRADVQVEEFISKRIWGKVVSCEGKPLSNTLVKLVKVVRVGCDYDYIGMAHAVTDCEGFYQFDVCAKEESEYKILVNKAVIGDEIVLKNNGGNCKACKNVSYEPCEMPKRFVVDTE